MTANAQARHAGAAGVVRIVSGLSVCALIAVAAVALARVPALAQAAVSPLLLAIVIGIAAGNLLARPLARVPAAGFGLARGPLLRLAIVLYAFRISLADLQAVGAGALGAGAAVVVSTLLLAWYAGRRWFGLDRDEALLIGSGSAICGAAAVLATAGILRPQPAKVGVAVTTVVVFGTAAMFVYPVMTPVLADWFGLAWNTTVQGIYIGATIHEVAQVLVAGTAIGADGAHAAVVTKMMRVCMLAPFLLTLAVLYRPADGDGHRTGGVRVPWFAVVFLVLIAAHPLFGMPAAVYAHIAFADDVLLAAAMAALGLTVRLDTLRAAGARPMVLGLLLFAHLVVGGLAINAVAAGF
jgi:uncharacterized integral membrane protein (TIGR00698 family)